MNRLDGLLLAAVEGDKEGQRKGGGSGALPAHGQFPALLQAQKIALVAMKTGFL